MASIGLQHQLGAQMAVESNYVFTGGRKEEYGPNINLTYDPVTGANYPFQNIARRPFPDWGVIRAKIMGRRSNYHGWESSFTKRFSDRWQANARYARAWFRDDDGPPAVNGLAGQVVARNNHAKDRAAGIPIRVLRPPAPRSLCSRGHPEWQRNVAIDAAAMTLPPAGAALGVIALVLELLGARAIASGLVRSD
jgi:hypothetical protein